MPVRLLLYKRPNGYFALSRGTPLRKRVAGSRREDISAPEGSVIDFAWRMDICAQFAAALLGTATVARLQPFEGVEIDLAATVVQGLATLSAHDNSAAA